ncbi:MAG: DUF502 domain-containing protein [Bacillota bacterium]|nr:DUF502 domain-containing protein [Bacillota bacterium]
MKQLVSYFLRGLLFTVPLAVTIYVFYAIFTAIDGLLNIPIPGVGFLITLILVIIIGFLTSNIFTQKILAIIDSFFNKLPIVKLIYSSLKDLMGAFVGDKKSFDKPVLVDISANGVKVVGFVTQEDLSLLGLEQYVTVYLPQSYNFAGNLIIVPSDKIIPVNLDSSAVMTFIVSGGVVGKK